MGRTGYSRRHYRLVSPLPDTLADIRERSIHQRACTLAIQDRERQFPVLTAENAAEAIRYQNERIMFHTENLHALMSGAAEGK